MLCQSIMKWVSIGRSYATEQQAGEYLVTHQFVYKKSLSCRLMQSKFQHVRFVDCNWNTAAAYNTIPYRISAVYLLHICDCQVDFVWLLKYDFPISRVIIISTSGKKQRKKSPQKDKERKDKENRKQRSIHFSTVRFFAFQKERETAREKE